MRCKTDQALEWDQRGLEIAREYDVVEAEANSLINLGCDFAHLGEDRKTMPAFRGVDVCFNMDMWMRWQYNLPCRPESPSTGSPRGIPKRPRGMRNGSSRRRRAARCANTSRPRTSYSPKLPWRRGDLAAAEVSLAAALDQLHNNPAPLVAWRTYVVLGRLRRLMGDGETARGAFAQAAAIVGEIAANVRDEGLRAIFLNSTAVREVLDGAKASSPIAET